MDFDQINNGNPNNLANLVGSSIIVDPKEQMIILTEYPGVYELKPYQLNKIYFVTRLSE